MTRSGALLVLLAAFGLVVGCAKSDPVAPGEIDDGFGGRDAGSGGSSSSESGPDGAGGRSSGSDAPSAGNGGADGDDQSSAATGLPAVCGDDTCDLDNNETCVTCPGDCGACEEELCGDATCDAAQGETCETCPADCGTCVECGDGVCDEPAEECDLCAADCGVCVCEADDLEPNNNSPVAVPLSLGVAVDDLSICLGDVDWFSFPVNGTRTITIEFVDAEGDLNLEIFSAATVDYVTGSYSTSDNEQVVLSGQPSGTYWARVYGDGEENRRYAIVVD